MQANHDGRNLQHALPVARRGPRAAVRAAARAAAAALCAALVWGASGLLTVFVAAVEFLSWLAWLWEMWRAPRPAPAAPRPADGGAGGGGLVSRLRFWRRRRGAQAAAGDVPPSPPPGDAASAPRRLRPDAPPPAPPAPLAGPTEAGPAATAAARDAPPSAQQAGGAAPAAPSAAAAPDAAAPDAAATQLEPLAEWLAARLGVPAAALTCPWDAETFDLVNAELRGAKLRGYDTADKIRNRSDDCKIGTFAAFVDPRPASAITFCPNGGGGEVSVAQYWAGQHCSIGLGPGRGASMPCVAFYKPKNGAARNVRAQAEAGSYSFYPFSAILIKTKSGEPARRRPPIKWLGSDGATLELPPFVADARSALRQRGTAGGQQEAASGAGAAAAGSSGGGTHTASSSGAAEAANSVSAAEAAGNCSDADALGGGSSIGNGGSSSYCNGGSCFSGHMHDGFEALVKRLEPEEGTREMVRGVTDEVNRLLLGDQRSGGGSCHYTFDAVIRGGSTAKNTHLPGRRAGPERACAHDVDLIVLVAHSEGAGELALRHAMACATRKLTEAGWVEGKARPLKHVSFELPPAALATRSWAPAGAAALPPLQMDLTPVPAVPSARATTWKGRHGALLPPLLAGRDARGCYPPRDGAGAARTLQVTGSEVELVKAQRPQLRAAMRALKAWRSFGGHGVSLGPRGADDAGDFTGAACEVIVMAAAGRGRLVDPLLPEGRAGPFEHVGRPLDAFAAALRLMGDRLRPGNAEPIYAPVWYGGEGPVAWEPAERPFTPIILNPADPSANYTANMKMTGELFNALADAAGELLAALEGERCESAEDWRELLGRCSLGGVVARFGGGGCGRRGDGAGDGGGGGSGDV
ncbi:hypothetical protein Rsub_11870 [Raphidocelis subcapitata]|uniref:Uncharacterized protein n=1 Tax=Raphidocelis subcapitata TaxID=307507 RepID=A0A2V0PKY3_9CHLO|nr:hypothetical protein Rsub_08228 [Raphidocelis subcapitata]GBF98540.1 hypothetical protein Rsub_11870 [Raphidocelis subcapitata]|eukprot:GBF95792.1 hypothetical protein Rsub_08228 [Raphidocelis subcapitata]